MLVDLYVGCALVRRGRGRRQLRARSAVTIAGRISEHISERDQHPTRRQGLQKSNDQLEAIPRALVGVSFPSAIHKRAVANKRAAT
jgi:hypothetical protein